jgi:hypothetical protein
MVQRPLSAPARSAGRLGLFWKTAGLAQALNGSFTEAVQRDNKHVRTRTFVWLGKL